MLYITHSLLIFNNLILFFIENKSVIYFISEYSKKVNMCVFLKLMLLHAKSKINERLHGVLYIISGDRNHINMSFLGWIDGGTFCSPRICLKSISIVRHKDSIGISFAMPWNGFSV